MKIIEKIKNRNTDCHAHKIPKIVAFGDSCTQGCFELIVLGDGKYEPVYDKNSVYHAYLSDILAELFPRAAVTVVNAGINGDDTEGALKRIERDVISENPDLTIVSFMPNDCVVRGWEYAETYEQNLREIFTQMRASGSEIIFLTHPLSCVEISPEITDPTLRRIAKDISDKQKEGLNAHYKEIALKVAAEFSVPVCDINERWKDLYDVGVNTDSLLSNHINHPVRSMGKMTARMLLDIMLTK